MEQAGRFIQPTSEPTSFGKTWPAKILRAGALGAAEGAGIPETQTTIRDLLRGLAEPKPPLSGIKLFDPTAGAASAAVGIGKNLYGAGKEFVSGIRERDPEAAAHGLTSGVVQALMLKGITKAGKIKGVSESGVLQTGKGFINPKPALEAAMHDRAIAVRSHVAEVGEAVKTAASAKMDAVSKLIDSTGQTIPQQPIQTAIRAELGNFVKIPETLPRSLNKILSGPTLEQASVFRGAGQQMRGSMPGTVNVAELPPAVRERMAAQIPELRGQTPIPNTEAWTFEQLKQLRSDLGREIYGGGARGIAPAVRAASKKAYKIISDALEAAAKDAKVEGAWKEANDAWGAYMADFQRSPLRKVVNAPTAADTFDPLIGKSAEQVRRVMKKYEDPFGLNVKEIGKEAQRFESARSALSRGKISKWDVGILASTIGSGFINPKFPILGALYEGGRLLEPRITQRVITRGAQKAGPILRGRLRATRK